MLENQHFTCGKYLSFATLVTPITVLGAKQFAFPCKKNRQTSAEEVCSMSRHQNWSLFRQNNSKSMGEFQTFWIFNMFTCSNLIPSFVWKPNRKLILYYGKVKETYFPSVKKAKILSFVGTKSCLTKKNYDYKHNFF